MKTWAVTGASGSVGGCCVKELLAKNYAVHAVSRKPFQANDEKLRVVQVNDYAELVFPIDSYAGLIVSQGFFHFEELNDLDHENCEALIEANFTSQINVVRSFLKCIDKNCRTDIVILGSTNAFHAGRGTTVYGAAKAGMLGFVRALNEEYLNTDVRFWFISTGTLANEMGAKVPNQDPSSLLDPTLVAKRIIETVTTESNLWEPEITIRRRHIRLAN
jgi:short-subunit dehydrogenase